MNKRRCEFYEYERIDPSHPHLTKVKKGEAVFHGFGVGYEEFESGPGNFSTAIIEKEDGTVENIFVEMIRFLDGGKDA